MPSQSVRTDGMRARTLALYALTVLENPEVCVVVCGDADCIVSECYDSNF